MAARVLTALFDEYDTATTVVEQLEAAGIPHSAISILANRAEPAVPRDEPFGEPQLDVVDPVDAAGTGATVGTVLGGGAGLLAGLGLLAIPGLGPVVAAGWLVAAAAGAGVGAAAGGLIGGLTGAGLSEDEAQTYAEGVRRGGTLVTVQAEDHQADRVMAILDRGGSIDLDERAEGWRAQGWTGDASAKAASSA
ncbi:hypothetical protein FV242_26100 [Methylobacterium sp. WL64]|uniref:hypothetical protein n=1 Tax=Methylobacterium sp. WL64 TaxID=2603894 RepID=UPI0011C9271F|nr:hypothetical protein [Methylobacterium sp. WL64]TXM99262.1 hypothetical protein FV242_26100 [Methylobacterium sp. WL64]